MNWELLTPRNIVVIGVIAIIWHVLLSSVFQNIGRVGSDTSDA